MRILNSSTYPNGKSKSLLYDMFLTYRMFWCTEDDFNQDLEDILLAERLGTCRCEWYEDSDGRQVVAGLELLRDPGKRVVITRDGFIEMEKPDAAAQLFISYAREDFGAAERLAEDLARAGLRPWIDQHDLLGGQKWRTAIVNAIRKCDLFLPLISSRSVNKKGFVQHEIRYALDIAEEIPEHDVYILPVRLEACEPQHPSLRDIHWIDVFPDWRSGTRKLVRSVCAARARDSF